MSEGDITLSKEQVVEAVNKAAGERFLPAITDEQLIAGAVRNEKEPPIYYPQKPITPSKVSPAEPGEYTHEENERVKKALRNDAERNGTISI